MISRTAAAYFLAACCAVAATTARADDPPQQAAEQRPVSVVQQVYDCRSITDAAQRLACYDTRVDAMQQAQAARDIRVVDREDMRETRRGLFGFSLSNIRLFGGGDDEEDNDASTDSEVVTEITAALTSVGGTGSSGSLVLTLDNGQTWVQTDGRAIGSTPDAGQRVTIRRATMGSYVARIESRPGIRVRRTR